MKRWTLLFLLFGVCNFLWAQGSNVTLMGTWDGASLDYSDIWGYVDPSGGEYAIIGSLTKIHVVDVTVPSAPALVGELTPGNSSIWRDFKTYGNYAYGVADQGTEGLVVIDLSNVPSSISLAGQYSNDFKRAHNVFIDTQNGRLYVIGSSGGIHPANNGLIVYDLVANPANPVRLSSTPLAGGYVHDAFIKNHIAYCSHGTNGLYVYNMSNASSPVLLGSLTSYPEQGYNHSGWLSEDGNSYVFADETHGKKMKIANVSDLSNITVGPNNVFRQCLLAPGNNGCIPHNPFILGNFVYISYYHDGLQVFDISNPSNVTSVGYYDTYPGNTNYSGYEGAWGCYPYLPSGVVLISDISTGLYVLDFNMPLPVELVSFRGEYNAGTVTLNWSTMSELHNDYFMVERSFDGINFENIGMVDGHGNTSDPHDYQALDRNPKPGINYYRLRQVNFDGSSETGKVIRIEAIKDAEWSVFPTLVSPTNAHFQAFAPKSLNREMVQMSLYNLQGALMGTQRQEVGAAETMVLDLPGLYPGAYVLQLSAPGFTRTVRVMCQPE